MADSTDNADESPHADGGSDDTTDTGRGADGDTDTGTAGDAGTDSEDGGFSLTLPPITLPPLFPDDFRILWPTPGERLHGRVTRRTVAAALLAFDAVDAWIALSTDSAILAGVRVVGGALLAATTFGLLGVAYVWEAAAVLVGIGELTVVPTLAVLFGIRLLRDAR